MSVCVSQSVCGNFYPVLGVTKPSKTLIAAVYSGFQTPPNHSPPVFQYWSFARLLSNIFLKLGLGVVATKIFNLEMLIQPRPNIKIPNIAEIVPDKYSKLTFPVGALKLSKTDETEVQICGQTLANLIIQGVGARGSKKVMHKISKPQGLRYTYR